MIFNGRDDYITDFTADFELEPRSTALIVVDMQYATASRKRGLGRLLGEQGKDDLIKYRYDRIEGVVVPTVQRLLAFFRKYLLSVVYLTMGSRSPDYSDALPHVKMLLQSCNNRLGTAENNILEEIKPDPREMVVNKTTIGALNSTNLDSILWARGLRYLLFTGVSTNMCVESTAREAADRGFHCILIHDGCGASKPEYHEATLVTFQRLFGKVRGSEDVMEELRSKLDGTSQGVQG